MYLLLLLPLLLIGGGAEVVARKAEDENQEGGGDQGPVLGLGNTDLPQVKKNESSDGLHPLRSLLLEPHIPGPVLRLTPSAHAGQSTLIHTTHMLQVCAGHTHSPVPGCHPGRLERGEGREKREQGCWLQEGYHLSLHHTQGLPAPFNFSNPTPPPLSSGTLVR